ncbi:MAG TPA: hypothetical protein VJY40_08290 [Corynebacterium sp.]|nr:hypothetical protein [Corynebacterium sp.]
MMEDSGVATVPAGVERFEITHNLGRAPNVVHVTGLPDNSRVFTLDWRALLLIIPPDSEACEVEWSVGYVEPPEPERDEDEGTEW